MSITSPLDVRPETSAQIVDLVRHEPAPSNWSEAAKRNLEERRAEALAEFESTGNAEVLGRFAAEVSIAERLYRSEDYRAAMDAADSTVGGPDEGVDVVEMLNRVRDKYAADR